MADGRPEGPAQIAQNNSEVLTKDEAELYDRQIRLWGYEAQWKLKNARILVFGMDGLGAEIVKNIVLSGVKSVTMWDDIVATEEDFENQFLFCENALKMNRAEASKERTQTLNPLVLIECDKEPFQNKSEEYFSNFELVVSCNQQPSINLKLDGICRKLNVPFYATGVAGTFGFAFYDLKEHTFSTENVIVKKEGNVKKVVKETLCYPSLQEVMDWELNTPAMIKFLKKVPASIFLFKILCKFQEEYGRKPLGEDDYTSLLKICESMLNGVELPQQSFLPEVLRSVCTGMPSPVCAIVGAVVAQEIIKAVTQKGKPHHNFFFFDPHKLVGHVQYVGPDMDLNNQSA